MAIHSEAHTPDWYLRRPRERKWLVQCVGCQRVGYRADAPKEFFNRREITNQFQPLQLNSQGLCPECQEAHAHIADSE